MRRWVLVALLSIVFSTQAFAEHLWHDVLPDGKADGTFNAVIEIEKGSKQKMEVDHDTGELTLDRVLKGKDGYPANYGFIPRTLFADGDAIDVLVLGNKRKSGDKANVRVIGIMEMDDSGDRDHKLIAVDANDKRFAKLASAKNLPKRMQDKLRTFFETYKIPDGKVVKVGRFLGRATALKAIADSRVAYQQKFGK
jgi:inorganic pyrophosphatase